MISTALLLISGQPVSANPDMDMEQKKCVVYLKKCFTPEDYEYIGDFSTVSTAECFTFCKSTYTMADACDFDLCFEMCKVASGNLDKACPIPTYPAE
jgi:hypothetical protein